MPSSIEITHRDSSQEKNAGLRVNLTRIQEKLTISPRAGDKEQRLPPSQAAPSKELTRFLSGDPVGDIRRVTAHLPGLLVRSVPRNAGVLVDVRQDVVEVVLRGKPPGHRPGGNAVLRTSGLNQPPSAYPMAW